MLLGTTGAAALALRLPEPPEPPSSREAVIAPSSDAPAEAPAASDPVAALRDLWARLDAARARGVFCDGRPVPPAPELRGSVPLDEAASAVAAAEDADAEAAVKDAKFRGKLVQELVVRGPTAAEEAARAWLAAPEDCRALMDPFATHGGAAVVPDGDGYAWIVLLGRKR